jgi:hypothetical protein
MVKNGWEAQTEEEDLVPVGSTDQGVARMREGGCVEAADPKPTSQMGGVTAASPAGGQKDLRELLQGVISENTPPLGCADEDYGRLFLPSSHHGQASSLNARIQASDPSSPFLSPRPEPLVWIRLCLPQVSVAAEGA